MVVLLNLIVPVIILTGLLLSWKLKKVWPSIACVMFALVYGFAQPSYMPKGEVKRSEVPVFEQSNAQLQDRNLKPKGGEHYDNVVKSKIEAGLEFKPKEKE